MLFDLSTLSSSFISSSMSKNNSDDMWRLLLSPDEIPMDLIYTPVSSDIFRYETKRAGSLYDQLNQRGPLRPSVVMKSTNNNNTVGGIRDVQVHKSKLGKETRVETELQSCGPVTDLNINIIMDSDSNVSNAVGNSLEYESQDLHRASDETKTLGLSGGEGEGGEGEGNRESDAGAAEKAQWQQGRDAGERLEDGSDEIKSAVSGEEGDDEKDGDEEGEGEGDMDDAMKHYKRYLDGEKIETLRGPSKEEDNKDTMKKLPTGHLEKEGVVIGCMSVFADVHIKEFIVMLSDDMIQAFLVDPERFRSVANRTKCEIEVTRRILNRRMGKYRWLKYLVVIIRGPSFSSIDQCDKMMMMLFPPYKWRKPYGTPAAVSMYLKENTPDNTDLYFNYQRTGPCQKMFGEIQLRAPFRKTKTRPVEHTPWKMVQKRQQWGLIEPKNDRMERVISHVFPERGGCAAGAMDHSIKWAEAAAQAVEMSKAKDLARSQMLNIRKMESEPLYARAVGE